MFHHHYSFFQLAQQICGSNISDAFYNVYGERGKNIVSTPIFSRLLFFASLLRTQKAAERAAEAEAQSKRRSVLLRFCPVSAGVLGGGGKPTSGSGSGNGGSGSGNGSGGSAAAGGAAKKPPRTSFEEIAAFGAP